MSIRSAVPYGKPRVLNALRLPLSENPAVSKNPETTTDPLKDAVPEPAETPEEAESEGDPEIAADFRELIGEVRDKHNPGFFDVKKELQATTFSLGYRVFIGMKKGGDAYIEYVIQQLSDPSRKRKPSKKKPEIIAMCFAANATTEAERKEASDYGLIIFAASEEGVEPELFIPWFMLRTVEEHQDAGRKARQKERELQQPRKAPTNQDANDEDTKNKQALIRLKTPKGKAPRLELYLDDRQAHAIGAVLSANGSTLNLAALIEEIAVALKSLPDFSANSLSGGVFNDDDESYAATSSEGGDDD